MRAEDKAIRRIAELQRVEPAAAEAYVNSLCRQLGSRDGGRVGVAVAGLLEERRPCKAKDVARRLKEGIPSPGTAHLPTTKRMPETADSDGPDSEPVLEKTSKTDSEGRRDTRL